MTHLNGHRQEIDNLDNQLAELLERRFQIVEEIAKVKSGTGIATRDDAREQAILTRLEEQLKNPQYTDRIHMIIRSVLEASRGLQESIRDPEMVASESAEGARVAYAGIPGSNGESALIRHFGSTAGTVLPYETFEEVCNALRDGTADYGILPVENTITGAIHEVYDLIRSRNIYVVGETCLTIDHHLIGLEGTDLSQIKTVYSHPQGLEQCTVYLNQHSEWQQIPVKNTAIGVRQVAESKDPSGVAIGSMRAAQIYGLSVLDSSIQNSTVNKTRFLVLSTKMEVADDADRTSMVMVTHNHAGALHDLLGCFESVNLVRIESRPVPDRPWEYYIYLDAEAGFGNTDFQRALQNVRPLCPYFRLLGSYRKGTDC